MDKKQISTSERSLLTNILIKSQSEIESEAARCIASREINK